MEEGSGGQGGGKTVFAPGRHERYIRNEETNWLGVRFGMPKRVTVRIINTSPRIITSLASHVGT